MRNTKDTDGVDDHHIWSIDNSGLLYKCSGCMEMRKASFGKYDGLDIVYERN